MKVNATTIRLTVDGAALSSPVTVAYNTTPAGLDRLKMIVDNFAALPMPLRQTAGVVAA